MTRSLLSCLSQGSGYAALTGVFIAQAIKLLYSVLSASARLSTEAILTDGLRPVGLLIDLVLVVLIGEQPSLGLDETVSGHVPPRGQSCIVMS